MNVLGLARAVVFTGAMVMAHSASAFIDLGLPKAEPVPTSDVYVCDNGEVGGAVISIKAMKFYMTDGAADTEGLPMQMSDLMTARCPHTYQFNIDLMGEVLTGKLSGGCGGPSGPISLTLLDPADQSTVVDMTCVYKP